MARSTLSVRPTSGHVCVREWGKAANLRETADLGPLFRFSRLGEGLILSADVSAKRKCFDFREQEVLRESVAGIYAGTPLPTKTDSKG